MPLTLPFTRPGWSQSARWDVAGLGVFLLACFGAAGVLVLMALPNVEPWYAGLNKPAWAPSAELFGTVLAVATLFLALAGWVLWRSLSQTAARGPLLLYAVGLGLTLAWAGLFFVLREPGWAMAVLVVLWFNALLTAMGFIRRKHLAGVLMLPFLAWVTYLGAVNLQIWYLNRESGHHPISRSTPSTSVGSGNEATITVGSSRKRSASSSRRSSAS